MTIQAEHNWLASHWNDLEPFSGKWVAVLNCSVVASGNNFLETWNAAKAKFPNELPLVTYIFRPGEEQMIA